MSTGVVRLELSRQSIDWNDEDSLKGIEVVSQHSGEVLLEMQKKKRLRSTPALKAFVSRLLTPWEFLSFHVVRHEHLGPLISGLKSYATSLQPHGMKRIFIDLKAHGLI